MDEEFRVWIGCLACYNSGRLVGEWFSASGAGEVSIGDVHRSTPWSWDLSHEEFWVMDLDNAPTGVDGEMSPSEAQRIADVIESVESRALDADAYFAWIDYEGGEISDERVEEFEDKFCGVWDTFREYSDELADELLDAEGGREGFAARYFDWGKFSRDLLIGGDNYFIPAPSGQVYVFRSY